MGLEKIVNVQISRQTAGVTQAGFGVPLILGPNGQVGVIGSYSSIAAVAEDYDLSDAEYLLAQKIFSQTPRPPILKIGLASVAVAQISTITPDVSVQAITVYTVTIDGTDYAFTSDSDQTAAEVVTGLIALINADSNCKMTASGTTTLILTADSAGQGSIVAVGAKLTLVDTVENNGIDSDILKANDIDGAWYFLHTTAKDDVTINVASATIEAMRRMYVLRSDDADVLTNVTTDQASLMKAKNLFRTAFWFSKTPNDFIDGAIVGRVAPLPPGSETWAFKTMAAVTVDKLTDGEQANLDTKNVNYYVNIGGISVSQNGKVIGGEYMDVIRFIDWLQARLEEKIFGTLATSDKVPYTDSGIAIIENDMRFIFEAAVRSGGIASSQDYTITVPKAADISQNDKATRRLTGIKFTARLAGAIHAVEIQGTVTL